MAGAHEGGRSADWLAEHALIDQPACGLVAAAEEGVGGRADAQALGFCRIREAFAFGEIDAERLFGIGVFAGVQCAQAHLHMRLGDRQVDDDLHGGIGQQCVDAFCLKAEFIGPRLAASSFISASPRMSRMGNDAMALR